MSIIPSILDLRELAQAIHAHNCKVAHPDQCGWYQEHKDYGDEKCWDEKAHALFLLRAVELTDRTGLHPIDIVRVIAYL